MVFFNTDEFADMMTIEGYGYEMEINHLSWSTTPLSSSLQLSALQRAILFKKIEVEVIFDINTEVILDGGSEFGESVATVPTILLREEDAEKIEHKMRLLIKDKRYILNYKDEENAGLVRVYLEKRR